MKMYTLIDGIILITEVLSLGKRAENRNFKFETDIFDRSRMLIYLVIALFATVIGSLVGLGGGVIMKPLLQALSPLDALSINVLSSITVFFMAMSTLYKRTKADRSLYKTQYLYLIIGSLVGGVIGNSIFSNFLKLFSDENTVSLIQTSLLIILLVLVVFKHLYIERMPIFESKLAMVMIGVCLSIISTFLGIGGGPINVPVFIGLLGVSILDATYLSILVIFFSQLSNIFVYFTDGTFGIVELLPLIVMIPAAIAGGVFGGKLSQTLEGSTVNKLFNITIIGLIILNVYNLTLYI